MPPRENRVAIYHFSGQILGRAAKLNPDGSGRPGSKAAAAAAYRSGSQVRDYRTGVTTRKCWICPTFENVW